MNIESQVLNVPIEDIIPNRFQPRLNFDDDGLSELAASIKEHGIIQPLVLRRVNDKYEIIAGERRYKAAKMAGLTSVPAIISNIDDKKSAEIAIVENVQRRDLSAIEEAKSYKALLDKGYLTQEDLAKRMGLSQSAISNKLRLLSLSEEVQEALMDGKISERHARSLLQLSNQEEQNEWLNKILDERLTVRDLDQKIKEQINKNKVNDTTQSKDTEDVPVIDSYKDVMSIKENATDIVTPKIEDIYEQRVIEEKPIPNKFFNYLEDEQANMSLVEPTIEPTIAVSTLEENNNTLESNQSVEEEIELLDFSVPVKEKDFTKSDEIIDDVIDKFKENGYKILVDKDIKSDKATYTLTIE